MPPILTEQALVRRIVALAFGSALVASRRDCFAESLQELIDLIGADAAVARLQAAGLRILSN